MVTMARITNVSPQIQYLSLVGGETLPFPRGLTKNVEASKISNQILTLEKKGFLQISYVEMKEPLTKPKPLLTITPKAKLTFKKPSLPVVIAEDSTPRKKGKVK